VRDEPFVENEQVPESRRLVGGGGMRRTESREKYVASASDRVKRSASIVRRAPSHGPIGRPNPRFGRSMTWAGKRRIATCFIRYFFVKPVSVGFSRSSTGMVATVSSSSWSSSGARTSSDTAIEAMSTFVSTSYGR
jgi:hypothetical protein